MLMAVQAIRHSLFFTIQLDRHVTVVALDPLQMVLAGVSLMGCNDAFDGTIASRRVALTSHPKSGEMCRDA